MIGIAAFGVVDDVAFGSMFSDVGLAFVFQTRAPLITADFKDIKAFLRNLREYAMAHAIWQLTLKNKFDALLRMHYENLQE